VQARASSVLLLVAAIGAVACSTGARAGASTGSSASGENTGVSPGGKSADASTGLAGLTQQSGSTQPASGNGQAASGTTQAPSGAASGQGYGDASLDAQPVDAGPPPPDPVIALSSGTLKLEVWNPRTIRVIYGNGAAAPTPGASLAVNETRPLTPFTVNDGATQLTVTTSQLQAQVDKKTGQLTFLTPGGSLILANAAPTPHQLMPATTGPGPYTSIESFTSKAGEQYYGLGEHQQQQPGKLAYSGKIQLLQKNPSENSVPLLLSSGGYGILWDNPSVTTFDLGNDIVVQSEVASFIDYYFMVGPKADDVIASYRALTGPAPMFGRWALGYWQSHDHYASQSELLNTAATYRSKQIPIDNIVQDWQYWGSNPWGSHMFGSSYPDPRAMFATLHQTGFHAMLSVWGRFASGSPNYSALQSAGDFMTPALSDGSTYYYDAFSSGARALYWSQMNSELFSLGVDGWWLDSSEPELNANWGEFRNYQTSAGRGAAVYNAYPLMHTTAVHDGQRAASSDKRVFILTRSAYAGNQRNGAATWSGDITGDWATFQKQPPGGLNFTLSGIPYWTTDIGGYFLSSLGGVGDAPYTELFERWFQFGGFCPIFRTHGTGTDRDIYSFGPAAQTVLQGVDNLRYRLLPYIYSLSWMVTSQAYTMMRALVFDFASDPMALNVPDEYMFGPAFLVNPVTTQGATNRSVYLPGTGTWYDFWTGSTQIGGQTIIGAAPIDHLPLYVPAGAIVPMGPIMQYSTAMPCDPIELRVYPGADGTFTLYEDENENYDYEKGMYATIPFSWDDGTKTLHIGARQGYFSGMLQNRAFNVVFVSPGHGSGAAVSVTIDKAVMYTGAATDVTAP
jgi:alpha-D-xyloside xylohydrolase